jgi:hypothetical protein
MPIDIRNLKGNPAGILHSSEGGTPMGNVAVTAGYTFVTAIVKDVISNPEELLLNRVALDPTTISEITDGEGNSLTYRDVIVGKNGSVIKVDNPERISYAPINSIIAHIVDDVDMSDNGNDIICFPFFPPHLSLPVKPGEYVWLIKEERSAAPGSKAKFEHYFWMCRKVSLRQVDDINLTHFERQNDIITAYEKHYNNQGSIAAEEAGTVSHFNKSTGGSGLETGNSFNEIQRTSIAFKEEFTAEPVPRQIKDCADLLLQGSNNSHIMLGTEKFTLPEENTKDDRKTSDFKSQRFTGNPDAGSLLKRKPLSPAIDLCIGRKFSDLSAIVDEKVDSMPMVKNDIGVLIAERPASELDFQYMEIDKTLEGQGKFIKDTNIKEFTDFNPLNCLGRVYLTNSVDIDRTFGFTENDVTGEEGFLISEDENSAELTSDDYPTALKDVMNYGAVTLYAANLRFRCDATAKIYNSEGKSMITMTPQGDIILQANTDKGAKIMLEADGNIRIVPGEDGVVKIGADMKSDTDMQSGLVPVCGAVSATSYTPAAGTTVPTLAAPGLITGAAGGVVTESGGTGALSSKVIIK